jgi:hypothetical protein
LALKATRWDRYVALKIGRGGLLEPPHLVLSIRSTFYNSVSVAPNAITIQKIIMSTLPGKICRSTVNVHLPSYYRGHDPIGSGYLVHRPSDRANIRIIEEDCVEEFVEVVVDFTAQA